jgi:hypothetical protein
MRTRNLVVASILAGFPLMHGPVAAQTGIAPPTTDMCFPAPTPKAPEGSHWRYRTDSANHRCYFLRADGPKGQAAPTRLDQQRGPVAAPAPGMMNGRPMAGQPFGSGRGAPGRDRFEPMRERTTDDPLINSRWPDPSRAVGAAGATPASPVYSGNDASGMTGDGRTDDPSAAGSDSEASSAIDYKLMVGLLAVALVIAGVIRRMRFKAIRLTRSRPKVRRARPDITRAVSRSQQVMSSMFARAASAIPRQFHHDTMPAGARTGEEAALVPDEEEPLEPAHHDDGRPRPAHRPDSMMNAAEEIDVLLRQLERFGERPAA